MPSQIIKNPVQNGVAKVPVIMQNEALECGAACLAMVLAYYDKWIPLEQVREDCGVSRDGSNAQNIYMAANNYGLAVDGYRIEPYDLVKEGSFPCVIHWNFNHFVVLCGFKGDKACINDPSKGSIRVSMEEFDRCFTGVCLMFKPSANFVPEGSKKSVIGFAKKLLSGSEAALVYTLLTGIIAALIGVIKPGFSRVFLDFLLSGDEPSWLFPYIILLFLLSLSEIIMSAIGAVYSLRINGKMASVGSAVFMWKILNLPLKFFSQRRAGEIQNRESLNASVASSLIDTVAPLFLQLFMMIFYFVVMLRYSVVLTVVGLGSIILNYLLSRIISGKRINITRVSMQANGSLLSATTSGIAMIETIKASGATDGYFKKWAGHQAAVNTQTVKFAVINQVFMTIVQFINTIANSVVLVLGVYLTMQGQFTVGMVMAFQGFLTGFSSPAMTLVSAGQTIAEIRPQMEKIDDTMGYPSDSVFADEKAPDVSGEYDKIRESVEMKNVTFGYSPLASPVIKNFNLNLKMGKSVAIVGASGCGKSTVAKLLTGLYSPWSGEILFDGKPLSEYPKDIFRASVAAVDQDIILFSDTIENNIKMWDESIEDFEMILAAKDASIHEDIMKLKDGYKHKLTEDGKDFSGGQRQRLEIARVLAQDPTVVIMDEATSALDTKTEHEVIKSITDRGVACVVVAHRLSAIRSCDEIIVMENGETVGRGTHGELMETNEIYKGLVSAD